MDIFSGHIYYTGYAKFFSEDYSDECDKVSWSLWIYVSTANSLLDPMISASRLTDSAETGFHLDSSCPVGLV